MRTVLLGAALVGVLSIGACSFLNAGGNAATRWANIEKNRAMKANPELSATQICKSMTPTGSNLPTRVCSTQAEWDAREELDLQAAEELNRQIRAGGSQSGVVGQR